MARSRQPGYITGSPASSAFGLDVNVERSPLPKVNQLPNGDEAPGPVRAPFFKGYREVIPPGEIGSQEDVDVMHPSSQSVDTVPLYAGEEKDPRLHAAIASQRASGRTETPVKLYGTFQPRTAPMPRACQDDVHLAAGAEERGADPLMNDTNSGDLWFKRDVSRKDLYGRNVAGVLHNPIGGSPVPPTTEPQTVKDIKTKPSAQSLRRVPVDTSRDPQAMAKKQMSTAKVPATNGPKGYPKK